MNVIINKKKDKKEYHNGICIDWFEFTIFKHNYFDVINTLGFDREGIEFIDGYGQNRYKCSMHFNNITILYGDMGVHVRMTGDGCRNFEKYSDVGFDNLIKVIFALSKFGQAKMSRIDIAYDDFEGLIDIDKCVSDARNGNVVSRFRKGSIIESFNFNNEQQTFKTLNCGRQGSNIWITIYDKLAERKSKDLVPDCDNWVRCEIKMRHTNADRFIQLLNEGKPMNELYFLVLNNYVRFVVPSDTDSNKWRWTVAPHWAKFCNSVIDGDMISLYVAPSDDYNQYKLYYYVTRQAGAAVYTYIQKFGISDLMKQVEDKKYRLAFKYRQLLSDPDSEAESVSDSGGDFVD